MRSAGYVVPPSSVVLVQFERSSRSPFYRWVNNGDREGLLILFLRAPLNLTGIFFYLLIVWLSRMVSMCKQSVWIDCDNRLQCRSDYFRPFFPTWDNRWPFPISFTKATNKSQFSLNTMKHEVLSLDLYWHLRIFWNQGIGQREIWGAMTRRRRPHPFWFVRVFLCSAIIKEILAHVNDGRHS